MVEEMTDQVGIKDQPADKPNLAQADAAKEFSGSGQDGFAHADPLISGVPVLTFARYRGGHFYECQNQRDTSKYWFSSVALTLTFL